MNFSVSANPDFVALETRWRDLESRSAPSFFQSWTWIGCLVEERFPNAVLVEVFDQGRTVALALFNRHRRSLFLSEHGAPGMADFFVEFSGVLCEAGREALLTQVCLNAAYAECGHSLVLSGINSSTFAIAQKIRAIRHIRDRPAHFVDCQAGDFLKRRSTNTRYQLRRSQRHYEAQGRLTVERAVSLSQAREFFSELAILHQTSWIARGHKGAFANPFFVKFHHELVARGFERDEIDLLRIASGQQTIGCLYNFRHRDQSLAYQSGFDYANPDPHCKPGLTCHHQAIQFATLWGATRYDFLAGDARYKRNLADGAETLHWIEVAEPYAFRILAHRLRNVMARVYKTHLPSISSQRRL